MLASEPLFCFTSDNIEIHPCERCRAPMLARIDPAPGFDICSFECYNCNKVDKISNDRGVIS
jgi:hypothetical protein